MIARLYYVACDECGAPAGGGDGVHDTPTQARREATRHGWSCTKDGDYCVAHRPKD